MWNPKCGFVLCCGPQNYLGLLSYLPIEINPCELNGIVSIEGSNDWWIKLFGGQSPINENLNRKCQERDKTKMWVCHSLCFFYSVFSFLFFNISIKPLESQVGHWLSWLMSPFFFFLFFLFFKVMHLCLCNPGEITFMRLEGCLCR